MIHLLPSPLPSFLGPGGHQASEEQSSKRPAEDIFKRSWTLMNMYTVYCTLYKAEATHIAGLLAAAIHALKMNKIQPNESPAIPSRSSWSSWFHSVSRTLVGKSSWYLPLQTVRFQLCFTRYYEY